MSFERFAVVASRSPDAQKALEEITSRYKLCDPEDAEVIVALGGDGFMLETQHRFLRHGKPIYGMNRGTVGFLMNEFRADGLAKRVDSAHRSSSSPIKLRRRTETLASNPRCTLSSVLSKACPNI